MTHERRRCRGDQYGESRESGRGEYTWVTENDLMAWISIVNGIADEQVGAGGKCDSRASRIGKPLPNDPQFTSWARRMAVWMQPQSATAEVGHTTFASQAHPVLPGPLAQLVELRTFNPSVAGSSPAGPTSLRLSDLEGPQRRVCCHWALFCFTVLRFGRGWFSVPAREVPRFPPLIEVILGLPAGVYQVVLCARDGPQQLEVLEAR